jgi:hypothetical protein
VQDDVCQIGAAARLHHTLHRTLVLPRTAIHSLSASKMCLHTLTLTMGSWVMQRAVCWCACSAERMLICVDAGWRLIGLRSCSTGLAATRSTVDCSCRRHPFAKRAQAYARGMGRRCMMMCWCGSVLGLSVQL